MTPYPPPAAVVTTLPMVALTPPVTCVTGVIGVEGVKGVTGVKGVKCVKT